MKETAGEHIDADSDRSPSDNEKGTVLAPKASYGALPADPDAGRSEAEKAHIVSEINILHCTVIGRHG